MIYVFPVIGTFVVAQDAGRCVRGSERYRAVQGGEDEAKWRLIVVGTCSKVLSKGMGWAGGKDRRGSTEYKCISK